MMKWLLQCILFFLPVSVFGQQKNWQPVYNTQWCYLFTKPDNQSEKLGILSTEASLMLLDSTNYFYKVIVSNGDIGYILKQQLEPRMRGRKSDGEPEEYFYRGEKGLQSPHAFVQVSGLKARSGPGTQNSVVKGLPINDHISIDYVPFYKDGWVYIGDHFHDRPAYIQYKYLGKYKSFEKALDDYNKAVTKDQEKILVERLMEIGWSENSIKNRLQALYLFKAFHKKTGTLHQYPNLDFEIFMTEQMQNPMEYKEKEVFLEKADFHFLINDRKIYEDKITEGFAKSLGLKKTTNFEGLPECGWEPIFRYSSSSLEIVYEKTDEGKIYSIVHKMIFDDNNAIMLNKIKIGNKLSEYDFIKTFGRVVDAYWLDSPHVYRFQDGDAGFFEISFRSGKAYSYEMFYYC